MGRRGVRRLGPYTTSSGGPPSDSGANGQSRVQQDTQGADWKNLSLQLLSGWPKVVHHHGSWCGSMMSLLLLKTPVTITLIDITDAASAAPVTKEAKNKTGFLGLRSSF